MKGNGEKKRKHRVSNWVLVLILIIGIGIAAYPVFSEYWNSLHQTRAIMGYAERVAEMTNEEYEQVWNAALDYNERLLEKPNRWAIDSDCLDDYETQLNVDATGNMGYISIPKIDVNLPVYHGTSDMVLQTSIASRSLNSRALGRPRCPLSTQWEAKSGFSQSSGSVWALPAGRDVPVICPMEVCSTMSLVPW